MFNDSDLQQISKQGISQEIIQQQIDIFKKGFPFIRLKKAATPGDGIMQLNENDLKNYRDLFHNEGATMKMVKFVPSSGAASRMFKDLFSFYEQSENAEKAHQLLKEDPKFAAVRTFFQNIQQFAFFEELKTLHQQKGESLEENILKHRYQRVLELLLTPAGMNYGELPKALLKFHKYNSEARTPIDEHLQEGYAYCRNQEGKVNLHFTVSPQHLQYFQEYVNEAVKQFKTAEPVSFNISYSTQKPSTDTIAVDLSNNPFREKDGSLLFRPGGHGALLENLNEIEADIIFIKNIDNVVPDHLREATILYKKVLAGLLIDLQQQIKQHLQALTAGSVSTEEMDEIVRFMKSGLQMEVVLPEDENQRSVLLIEKLNRPIRVCGMVQNQGEPGGGPYWIENNDGSVSLQIIESSQVNLEDAEQSQVFKNATHFNPVDIVCAVRDFQGKKFQLPEFRDPNTGFISKKSKDGKELKALELPGLWNGSMADWNTVFVEVPAITFNPVKTVNDLLRKEHQNV
jgi:hypothetical protein